MESQIPTFLAVTGIEDTDVAKQYLELTNGDLDYAVTLFMESGGHQPGPAQSGNDEELAQRLQSEAYAGGSVREADTNVHRVETLVDSFSGPFGSNPFPVNRPQDMFGSARVGIFNQRYDSDEDEYYRSIMEVSDEDDDDYGPRSEGEEGEGEEENDIIVIDSDDEQDYRRAPLSHRRRERSMRQQELTSTQRRLANLFRPPFDIISKLSLEAARERCREESKWVLINIQDTTDFQSQLLNRDFWSKDSVKQIVRENFIFLQYQHDSPNGMSYTGFYSVEAYPHIAILDPLTGERVFKWKDGVVPQVSEWEQDVENFLATFSLLPGSSNPTVKHDDKLDPDTLTEEQQIELAMKQSIKDNAGSSPEPQSDPVVEEERDPFDEIEPVDHLEPTTGDATRIQIRFPNGKRLVHKFALGDKISTIFMWLKFLLQQNPTEYGISGTDRFNISNNSDRSFKFIESLDATVESANLKNASLLVEKQ